MTIRVGLRKTEKINVYVNRKQESIRENARVHYLYEYYNSFIASKTTNLAKHSYYINK